MIRKPPLLPIASSVLDTLQLDMATILQSNFPSSCNFAGNRQQLPFDVGSGGAMLVPERIESASAQHRCPPVKGETQIWCVLVRRLLSLTRFCSIFLTVSY